MTNDKDRKIIEQYLESSERELELSIARMLAQSNGVALASTDEDNLLSRLQEHLDDKLEVFRTLICDKWLFANKIGNPTYVDNVTLVAAIADLIASSVGIPPAITVATLLVKKGLDKLCAGQRIKVTL